jgi:hypothetical protein
VTSPLDVVTRFVADTGDLEAGAEKAKSAIGGISPAALIAGAGVVAAAGIAVSAIADMTKAAAEDEAEQQKLNAAIVAAGAATGDYQAQVDAAVASSQAKAFTDTQAREALQSLVTATGSVTEATALLSSAQDIARFAGVDLATAADAVAKAHAGNAGALQKLIPGLEKSKSATDTLAAAQAAAAGQADTFASSTEGSLQIASDSFGELGETIGSAFLPLLKAIMPPLVKLIAGLGTLIEAVLPVLTPLIATLGTVLGVVVDVLVTLVQWVTTLFGWLAKKLQPAFAAITPIVEGVGKAIGGVVDWIRSLLDWIGKAIDSLGRFLDSLNPLKGISLPSLPFSLAAPAPAGATTRAGSSRAVAGTMNVTINTSADPEGVVRALRRWAGNNGGRETFLRALDRGAS